MKKRTTLALVVIVLTLAVGVGWYTLRHRTKTGNTPITNRLVTKEGVMSCLEFRDKSKPHILSCAIGMKQDNGTSYGLKSDDPSLTGSIPTGQHVRVTGTLTEQSSEYDMAGVITVHSIEKL